MSLVGQETFAEAVLTLPGDLPRQVMDEFSRGWHMREVMAFQTQRDIAVRQPEQTWCEGIGQKTMSIAADAYHYWGQRVGYDCWSDKQFRREFLRDNPEARVKSVATKTMVSVDGMKAGNARLSTPNSQPASGSVRTPGILLVNRFGGAA